MKKIRRYLAGGAAIIAPLATFAADGGYNPSADIASLQSKFTDIISSVAPVLLAIIGAALGIAGLIWAFRKIRSVAFGR